MNSDDIEAVQEALGRLILGQLVCAAQSQYFPVSNADDMDRRIREGKIYADRLRKIREDFENIVTGVIAPKEF